MQTIVKEEVMAYVVALDLVQMVIFARNQTWVHFMVLAHLIIFFGEFLISTMLLL
jgi:hypothetical protein